MLAVRAGKRGREKRIRLDDDRQQQLPGLVLARLRFLVNDRYRLMLVLPR